MMVVGGGVETIKKEKCVEKNTTTSWYQLGVTKYFLGGTLSKRANIGTSQPMLAAAAQRLIVV